MTPATIVDAKKLNNFLTVFLLIITGEVLCSKNGNPEIVLMCVDHSQTLWGVFDIYGTTTQIVVSKISNLQNQGGCTPNTIVQSTPQPSTSYETVSPTVCYQPQPPMVRSNILEVNTDANGGTVLIVNLPATQSNQMCLPSPAMSQASSGGHQQQVTSRPPSVTIQQIQQPRISPVQQPHLPEVRLDDATLLMLLRARYSTVARFCLRGTCH